MTISRREFLDFLKLACAAADVRSFLADRVNPEVEEYSWLHPSELKDQTADIDWRAIVESVISLAPLRTRSPPYFCFSPIGVEAGCYDFITARVYQ